jgi:hypothetical protein
MNDYDLFISSLKAMQLQGYARSKILDEWELGHPRVIENLKKDLVISILQNDVKKMKAIQSHIDRVKTLNKVINIGLLE